MEGVTEQSNTSWGFDLNFPEQKYLDLPQPIIDHICKFLPTQQDLYQACLINRTWREAATAVLWKAPQLRDPERFRQFYNCCRLSKRAALAVREINLCIHDAATKTVFHPIVKADLPRHDMKANMLSNPDLVYAYARQCEKLTSITMYGWRLEPVHLEQLAIMLTALSSIRLIGSNENQKQPFMLNIILPRLERLELDGRFWLTPQFSSLVASRATKLRVLQISLAGLEQETLRCLCIGRLDLHQLTLTNATYLSDVIVRDVLLGFPNLTKLCLTGCEKLTDQSILHALTRCPQLRDLEIRALPSTLRQGQDQGKLLPVSAYLIAGLNTLPANIPLQRMVLENWATSDEFMVQLARRCTNLITLGLSDCPNLTDASIVRLCMATRQLRVFNVIRCPGAGLDTWTALKKCKDLRNFYLESSGEIQPKNIYDICCACANLKMLVIEGYPDIAKYITSQLLVNNSSDQSSTESLSLNTNAIAALINATDPKLTGLPETRHLTGEHIINLAKELGMSVAKFEEVLDMVQNDELRTLDKSDTSSERRLSKPNQVNETEKKFKPLPRVELLREHNQPRPATPALWAHANDAMMEHYLPGINRKQTPTAAKVHTPTRESSTTLSQANEPDETNETNLAAAVVDSNSDTTLSDSSGSPMQETSDVEDEQTVTEHWPVLGGQKEAEKTIDLGGWGTTNKLVWKTSNTSTRSLSSNTKATDAWDPNAAMNRTREWQQKPLENPVQNRRRRGKVAVPQLTMESEGWGEAGVCVPWDDLRTQGFAHDVLQKQRSTPYWNSQLNAWCSAAEGEVQTQKVTAARSTEAWPVYQQLSKTPTASRSQSKTRQGLGISPNLSSDESVDWEEDDGVTIKTATKPMGKDSRSVKKNNGSMAPPEHPGDPKWHNLKEWHRLKGSATVEHPNSDARDRFEFANDEGWSEPDLLSDETSAETSSNSATNAKTKSRKSARPSKQESTAAPRRSSVRELIPPEAMAGRWGDFRPAEATSEMLVDTSDIVNKPNNIDLDTPGPKGNTTYSDLWSSMSSLTKPETRENERGEAGNKKTEQNMVEETYVWKDEYANKSKEVQPEMRSELQSAIHPDRALTPTEPVQPPKPAQPVQTPLLQAQKMPQTPQTAAPASPQQQSPNGDDPGTLILELKIETTKHGTQPLKLYENRSPDVDVRNYCEKFDMMEIMPRVLETAWDHYTKRKTKLILGKRKKAKAKTTSTLTSTDTLI
ncbi:hypothetical protein DFQ28_000902 [Apophysomyces sp. BC1034]|nr:hypothetical protein DFQ30_003092 [Apophysomyces sp. BC1015]KAG0180720.1 hypothetical protein DFQ29_000119 [Apophysomyces sp. BC1021]KAG0191103.1 hypothetical protein DFQ28_000902 [Apophysomyces sp. BC1034]